MKNKTKYVRQIITGNLISFIICLSFLNSYSQERQADSLKCNISIINEVYENIENISSDLMLQFLKTFGEDCKNNIEFSEFSNETLFKVIQKKPELFCKMIEKLEDEIELDIILLELETPLLDLINMKTTRNQIKNTKISDDIKKRLLDSIDKAINY
jgi:DNA-binding protein Fis